MNLESVIALILATALLGLSPGPAVFATIGRSLSLGFNPTCFFIFGIVIADFLFSLLAMSGLSATATNYDLIFTILKIIGGSYLIYLGILGLLNSIHTKLPTIKIENRKSLIVSGFLLTTSNPKDIIFFIGFLHLFINSKNIKFIDMILVSSIITIVFIITLSIYALLANYARTWLSGDNTIKLLNKISGIILIFIGSVSILINH